MGLDGRNCLRQNWDMKSLTVKDIFDWWRDLKSFAADVGQKYETVKKWRQRGRIPNEHWPALIVAARAKGKRLSADSLLSMHVKRRMYAEAVDDEKLRNGGRK